MGNTNHHYFNTKLSLALSPLTTMQTLLQTTSPRCSHINWPDTWSSPDVSLYCDFFQYYAWLVPSHPSNSNKSSHQNRLTIIFRSPPLISCGVSPQNMHKLVYLSQFSPIYDLQRKSQSVAKMAVIYFSKRDTQLARKLCGQFATKETQRMST